MAKYEGNWDGYRSMIADFYYFKDTPPRDFPKEEDIIFAEYNTPSYDGYAIIVFVRDRKLMEFNDSHCSCNGLSWEGGEETSAEALLMRPKYDYGTSKSGLAEQLALHGYEVPDAGQPTQQNA